MNVGFKELHTRIWIVLHNVGCTFKLLPQNFYAVLIHHSAEVMRYLKWILYAYQMTIVPNSPCPVFLVLAEHINRVKNTWLVTGTAPTKVLISICFRFNKIRQLFNKPIQNFQALKTYQLPSLLSPHQQNSIIRTNKINAKN